MSAPASDPFSLAGRTVLVTGASSGLGQAACRLIAQRGGRVLATGRDESRLAATVASLADGESTSVRAELPPPAALDDATGKPAPEASGHRHEALVADLLNPGSLAGLVAEIGTIDGLVLAAGVSQVSPLRYTTTKVLNRVMAINLEARLALCQMLMAKRKFRPGASLVFISTLSVTQGVTGHVAYAASLAANEGASRAIAAECVGTGMRSNVVAPGLVRTPLLDAGDVPREKMDELIAKYPLGVGEPEDVAAAVVYLLAPASRWITGQVIRMDGGYTLDV